VERTERRSRLLTSAVVWTVLLMLWAMSSLVPNVAATYRLGGYASGSTYVKDSAPQCNAAVGSVVISVSLVVVSGDTVYYELYYSWDDRRTSGPDATHTFTITVIYPNRQPLSEQVPKVTEPGDGPYGPLTLTLDVVDVEPGVTVSVTWSDSVTIPGVCSDSDSAGPYYQDYTD
jgi:hypothetical protein